MSFNLKNLLTPKTCEDCKFLYDSYSCMLDAWEGGYYDTKTTVHKDCPLLRIKCENCKHKVFCEINAPLDTACIEFEEAK